MHEDDCCHHTIQKHELSLLHSQAEQCRSLSQILAWGRRRWGHLNPEGATVLMGHGKHSTWVPPGEYVFAGHLCESRQEQHKNGDCSTAHCNNTSSTQIQETSSDQFQE